MGFSGKNDNKKTNIFSLLCYQGYSRYIAFKSGDKNPWDYTHPSVDRYKSIRIFDSWNWFLKAIEISTFKSKIAFVSTQVSRYEPIQHVFENMWETARLRKYITSGSNIYFNASFAVYIRSVKETELSMVIHTY